MRSGQVIDAYDESMRLETMSITSESARLMSPRAVLVARLGMAIGTLAMVAMSGASPLHAAPVTGTGANVTWVSGSAGATTASGAFDCGVTASVSMAVGGANSGVAYPVDWSTSTGTAAAFTGGLTPASAVAVYSRNSGVAGTISFGAEITDPVVMVSYIDPGQEMDFGSSSITLLSSHSGAGSTASVVGNKVVLNGPHVDTVNDSYAVRVSGTFGPTSGPMSITTYSTIDETVAISVASETICPPPAPGQPGQPAVEATKGGIKVTVTPPSSGGAPSSYVATAGPGGKSCTVTGSTGSCTITGLSSGTSYTVTVVAKNAGGDSTASTASASVTPLPGTSVIEEMPDAGVDSLVLAGLAAVLLAIGAVLSVAESAIRRVD